MYPLNAPPPASVPRRGSLARTRRIALTVALAVPVTLALAYMYFAAASPSVTHPPVIVRTGTPPTPFITVAPHMEPR